MKAVILAAGMGSRLQPLTLLKPKCLVRVNGISIIEHQILSYYMAGINKIVLVLGYKANMVREILSKYTNIPLIIIENINYQTTNNMFSLYLARNEIENEEFILSNGDVIYDPSIISDLVNTQNSDLIACQTSVHLEESMKISINSIGNIDNINKNITKEKSFATSIDLYRFSSTTSAEIFKEIVNIIEVKQQVNNWTEVALSNLFSKHSISMKPYDITNRNWVEIDNIQDLLIADRTYSKIQSLTKKQAFFIDLDGTIYNGNTVVQGASEFINKLIKLEKIVYFISNNSSKSKSNYVEKLANMNIFITSKNIILSTDGVIKYLKEQKVNKIFIIGTTAMKELFSKKGFINTIENPEFVILGYDTELTYDKLKQGALLINNGIPLIATHCDIVCPTLAGPVPDIGSILALLSTATGKTPFKVFGKPNPDIILPAMTENDLSAKDCVIIADRIYTDMVLAENIGCDFICVLTGETNRNDIETLEKFPDLIVDSIKDLLTLI